MGRFFYPLVFLIAFSAFVFGGSVEATFFNPVKYATSIVIAGPKSTASKQVPENTNQLPETQKACDDLSFWERTDCDPTAYFTKWIAIFTGLLAVLTGGLWIAALGTLNDGRETSKKQLRAYIGIVKAHAAFLDGNRPVYQVVMKNGGQTPAYNVVGRFDVFIRPLPLDAPLKIRETADTKRVGTIGPSGDYHARLVSDQVFGSEIIEAIEARKVAIFAVGDIRYKDVFGGQWTTNFCVVFDDMSLKDTNHQMAAWIDGNEST